MSLTIAREPDEIQHRKATSLHPGTWFLENDGQVYVIVLDDRTHENRVLCLGNFYQPFITNLPLHTFQVSKILQVGTLLQISTTLQESPNHE
jgi:hypothetical protein